MTTTTTDPWRVTRWGDCPALRRERSIGYEVIQLDSGELGYWRIVPAIPGSKQSDEARVLTKIRAKDLVQLVPTDQVGAFLDFLEQYAKRRARTLASDAERGARLYREGKYEAANELLDDLSAWIPWDLSREVTEARQLLASVESVHA